MTRRDWWLGLVLFLVVLAVLRAFPRYEIRNTTSYIIRIDRWAGRVSLVTPERRESPAVYLDDNGDPHPLPPGQAR